MGKRFIFILMACSLLSIATVVHAQHIDKQTYIFAIKKVDTLKLDKYVMIDQIQGTQSKPVILFAFGGGFKGGRRDNPDYISYFHFLARAGYVVVSTDYRTQLKDIDKSEYSDLQGFSSALQQAITCAVEDFGDATNYIIEHSVEWQIYNPQIQISAESETKRSIFREKDKTKRSKKESAQHSKSRNKSFVMTSVSAL